MNTQAPLQGADDETAPAANASAQRPAPALTHDTQSGAAALPARAGALVAWGRHWLRQRPAPSVSRARRPLPWRVIVAQGLSVWLATRLALALLSYLRPLLTGPSKPTNATTSLVVLVQQWVRWDGAWYVSIAQQGYATVQSTSFFPLYPLLIKAVSFVTGPHWATAGLLAANLGSLLAFIGLSALAVQVSQRGDDLETARFSLYAFAAYPLAFFLAAAYSDGLFAGLVAFALLFGFRRRWGWTAVFALLAGLCRPTGVALVAPLAWEALQDARARLAAGGEDRLSLGRIAAVVWRAAPALVAAAAPGIGLLAYMGYLWLTFGHPKIFLAAESQYWGHVSMFPLRSLLLALRRFYHTPMLSTWQSRTLIDLVPVLGAIAITLYTIRRAPFAFTLYLAGTLYLALASPILFFSDIFISGGRYILVALPLFIYAGDWMRRRPTLQVYTLALGFMLQAAFVIFFLGGGWII